MFRLRFWRVPALLAALLTLLSGQIAAQTQPTTELPRDDRWSTHIQPPPGWETDDPPPAAVQPAVDMQRPDPAFTRLAFTQFYAGDWDLVVGDGDGNNLVAITNSAANEIMPALNRGATQIAYVSDANGRPNIYVANADGSGVRRLTDVGNREFAYWPQWSYDGRLILYYHGGRDIRSDIWVMDANGGNRRRLTDEGQWNGDPSWTPQGHIVYVSQRDGRFRIWRMDGDGGNKLRINDIASSFTPHVSPDGQTLAYVADADQNLWQEVYTQWYAGPPQPLKQIIYGTPLTRFEARGFSPDVRFLQLTQLIYVGVPGGYQLDDTRIYWHKLFVAGEGETILNQRRAADGSLANTDLTPPTAGFDHLPPRVPAGARTWFSWQVGDSGGGHVVRTDVEHQRGNGDWQPVAPDNPEFPITTLRDLLPAERHTLRIRAMDNLFNTSAWFGPPAAAFSVYAANVTGRVTDVRGAPLPATLPTGGSDRYASSGATDGAYDLLLGSSQPPTLQLTRAGYGALPPALVTLFQQRARHDFVLRPANDVIVGGQFEATQRAGDSAHSGSGALRIGSDGLTFSAYSALPLPEDTLLHYGLDGNLYILKGDVEGVKLYVVDDGVLSAPQIVTEARLGQHRLSETSDGALILVGIEGGRQIVITRRPPGGAWQPPLIVPLTGSDQVLSLEAAPDALGGLFIAWSRAGDAPNAEHKFQPLSLYLDAAGNLSALTSVPWTQLQENDGTPEVALHVLPDGRAFVHSGNLLVTRTRGGAPRLVRIRNADGAPVFRAPGIGLAVNRQGQAAIWSSALEHATLDPATGLSGPRMDGFADMLYLRATFLDDDGTLHFLYMRSRNVDGAQPLYTRAAGPGVWTGGEGVLTADAGSHDIAGTWFGGPIGAPWLLTAPATRNMPLGPFALRVWQDGRWSAPLNATLTYPWPTTESRAPQLLLNIAGQPAIGYAAWNPALQMDVGAYETLTRATANGLHTGVTQTVTVPTDGAPTLSLFYRLALPVGAQGGLHVTVRPAAGGAPTTVLRGTTFGGWQHAWADLTAWAGQTVALTVGQQHVAGQPFGTLYVDELTLGSAYADLRVTLSAPADLLPGASGPARVTYANIGGVGVPDATLTLELPAGLTLLAADPPPAAGTLTWPLGALAAHDAGGAIALTLAARADAPAGSTLQPAVVIRTATGEAETANNRASAPLLIGMRVYAPVLRR